MKKKDIIIQLETFFDIEINELKFSKDKTNFYITDLENDTVKTLRLSGINLGNLNVLLPLAEHLEELRISNCEIANIAVLKRFGKLRELQLNSVKVVCSDILLFENKDDETEESKFLLDCCAVNNLISVDIPSTSKKILIPECNQNELQALAPIAKFINKLQLWSSNLSNIRGLQYFNQLKIVELSEIEIDDFILLSSIAKSVNILDLYKCTIKSCKGLHYFNKLKTLNLSLCTIESYEGIEHFTHIEILKVFTEYSFDLHNLLPLVSSLRVLVLNVNILENIELIEEFKQLEKLEMSTNDYILKPHLKRIATLPYLKELILFNLFLKKINDIEGFEKLEVLQLFGGSTSIINTPCLKNLHTLHIEENVCSIYDICPLPHLKELNITFANIRSLEGLNNFPNLEILILKANEIDKIEGLDKVSHLKKLSLSGNPILKIEGLDILGNSLKELNLSYCNISEIKGLDGLTKLEKLHLHENHITQITNLSNLVNLEYLNLQENNISKIEGLEKLKNLRRLVLFGNPIDKIELEKIPTYVNLKDSPPNIVWEIG